MEKTKKLRDGLIILACIAVLLAALRLSAEIVVPFILSLFITIIATSPLKWLKAHGVSNALSIIIVIGGVVFTLGLVTLMVGDTASQFNQALPGYQTRLIESTTKVTDWLKSEGITINTSKLLEMVDPTKVMAFANTFVSGIGDVLSSTVLILFMVIFMLFEASGLSKKINAIDNKRSHKKSDEVLLRLTEIVNGINRYAVGKSVVSLITGVLIWISLEMIGLDFAALWGALAFALNFIPNIGSILAAIPAVLLAIIQLDPTMTLVVVVIYLTVNMLTGTLIEPLFLGQRVGLSMLAVFLSLLFWGWMFGAVGMLLSVPLTMVVKFAAQDYEQTRWLTILLSPPSAIDLQ